MVAFLNSMAPWVKAANTRSCIPYCLDLQQRAVEISGDVADKHMLKVVHHMAEIYSILYGASTFLTCEELSRLDVSIRKLGNHWQWLAVNSFNALVLAWKQTPKLHYIIGHLHWQARLINPVHTQGYMNESMVGTLSKIYKASMRGPHEDVSHDTVVKKYCTGMIIGWSC